MLSKKILKYKASVLFLFVLLLSVMGDAMAQTSLGFRITDASVTERDTFTVTIVADSVLTGREVYSYTFYVTYSPTYLEFLQIEGTGTLLSSWGEPTVNSTNEGTIRIAGAGSSALSGSGDMIILKFVSKTSGGTNISFDTSESYLNERNPSSVFTNGYVSAAQLSTPNIYPDYQNMFIGDVVQMTVSGGEEPYVYAVENTSVAVITDQSKVQATGAGTTRVYVTDNKGQVSYTTGLFDVRSVRMGLDEVSAWPADTFYIPVLIEVAPGTNIYSGKIELIYDSGITGITNDIVEGDYQASFQSNAGVSSVSVSFASTSPITGSGILCYLGFRANSSGNRWINYGDITFNESLKAWTTKNTYYITVNTLPSISLSPVSGTLLWGDMLQVVASGGTAPYTYSVSNSDIATIDSQGNLKALSGGEVTVTAVDAHGAVVTSSIFTVNDCNVTVNNTDGVLDVDTRVPITVSQLPSGRSIYGFKGSFTFDDANLDFVRVDALSSILLEGTASGNTISLSGASSEGITSGTIGYLVFRIKNTLALNATAAIGFASFSANENTIYTSLESGYITRVEQVSYRPVANAGQDFSVQEGQTAQLDGSASYDNDNDPLTYKWIAPSGITLDDETSATPHFTAPWVSEDTPYIFKLVVNDGTDDSDTATVTVTVLQLNIAPTADAGEDKSYIEGSSVSLDGSNSYDPDGDPLAYNWSSLDGIVLFNSTGEKPSFILPQVTQNTEYRFKLVVNDGSLASAPDTVVITALQVNKKPVAFAGGDFEVNEGEQAYLDGSLSYDDDNDAITYLWTAPQNVILSDVTAAKPSFTAPAVHLDSVLSFTLVVNDGMLDSDPDEVLVTVRNVDILSTEAAIDSVIFADMLSFSIDDANNLVTLFMPYGYDITAMSPELKLSENASVSPESGSAQDFSVPVYYTVTAEDGTTVRVWKVVVDVPERTFTRTINAGWNNLSLNVKPSDMHISAVFGGMTFQELDYVKSTEYSATYYSSTGWFGDLESFPENRAVRLKKATADNLTVTGKEINPAITPISLVPGWNSIAYLLNKNVAVNDAFDVTSIPEGNVVLKGESGSSVYFEGTGWSGEIDSLRVLYGYKINVENSAELLYDAAGVTKSVSVARYTRDELLKMYNLNPSQFRYSSTLIAEVSGSDGTGTVGQGDLLIAYKDYECRGVSEARYISSLGRYVFVLTYYANVSDENVNFKLKNENAELPTDYAVAFTPDEITGSATAPKPLYVGEATGKENISSLSLVIYPNPVRDFVRISAPETITCIGVFNSLGIKVMELNPGSENITVRTGKLTPGIYTFRIESGVDVVIRKVIVASN
ncbi:MAG: T9SS type A sorting domain-containing protein [Chlorobi bacterium]|nr:T9SS type A sorting domain-containing protein [Chlorobiota bacterium]